MTGYLLNRARAALIETGAHRECEIHPDVILDTLDPGASDAAVQELISEIVTGNLQATQAEAQVAVNAVLAEHPDECGFCEKNMVR